MIAKFKTVEGWLLVDCFEALPVDEMFTHEHVSGLNDSSRTVGAEIDMYKCIHLLLKEGCGTKDIIYFSQDAYLMNDDGKTICSL